MSQELFISGSRIEYSEAFSGLGKIRRNYEENDIAKVRSSALITYGRRLDNAIALINRGFLEGDYGFKNLELIEKFDKVPKDYVKFSKKLWYSNNIKEILNAAEELWENIRIFAKVHNFEVKTMHAESIDKII
jgi:hypothetical protein